MEDYLNKFISNCDTRQKICFELSNNTTRSDKQRKLYYERAIWYCKDKHTRVTEALIYIDRGLLTRNHS